MLLSFIERVQQNDKIVIYYLLNIVSCLFPKYACLIFIGYTYLEYIQTEVGIFLFSYINSHFSQLFSNYRF